MAESKQRNVTDIIDIEYLQSIQDHLGKIIGITTALLDPNGVPVSAPTNLYAFCAMMQATESGLKMCMITNGKLIEINKKTRKPAVVTCPNSGLRTAAVPIFLDDEYLGSWLIGQIRMGDVDYGLIERTSEAAGLSRDEAQANMDLLPVIKEQEFEDTLSFLVTMTATLCDLVKSNADLDKRNVELTVLAEKLDNSVRAFSEFMDFSDLGAYLVDFNTGELIMSNSAYKRLFGITADALSDGVVSDVPEGADIHSHCPRTHLLDEAGEPSGVYIWEHYLTNTHQWLSVNSRALHWIDGRLAIMTSFMDITDRKREEQRISKLAYYDLRLGIPNSVKLFEDLKELRVGTKRPKGDKGFYLLCFDVQGLRTINDAYSREAGDLLLRDIVAWFQGLSAQGFNLYRIEGDDFTILAEGKTEGETMELADKIAERFEHAWPIDMDGVEQNLFTGAHIGIIEVPEVIEGHSVLDNIIERVLSFARKEGRVVLFDKKINSEVQRTIQYEIELKTCVLDNMRGFSLNYQPIVDATTGKWVGLEALCRWSSEKTGSVPPNIFIDTAEQLGLITLVSNWVLEEAIRQVKEWGLDARARFKLDVNLSPLQLRDPDLLPTTLAILKRYDYDPCKLSLEITETSEVSFDDKTLHTLQSIREQGVSLSLDDFGSGYATFSNLNNLPVDTLKTDRSFVEGIEDDAFLQQTVRSVIDLAHAAGLITIAEGVETESQLSMMVGNGVKMIQGYYFSKPLSADELANELHRFA